VSVLAVSGKKHPVDWKRLTVKGTLQKNSKVVLSVVGTEPAGVRQGWPVAEMATMFIRTRRNPYAGCQ
jgi:hypothetical protein